ncbi:unnamed protein product [Rhizoctonia solani]|uniref:Protein kinase domain-containing protein n=1 Tax=Rhizoctonia solani TaxID=456999 RepID=A0A8H3C1C5_9AGAM|nr:unnamed protein product [Rhizoctonia solani]
MANIANARRNFFNTINLLRRRGFLKPAMLVAAADLIDAPGLRQPERVVLEIGAALRPDILQALNLHAHAQQQIDFIDNIIASIVPGAEQIGREVQDEPRLDIQREYLCQAFIDKLEELKAKLVDIEARWHNQWGFHRGGIIQDLHECDRLLWETLLLDANQANLAISQISRLACVQVPSASPAGSVVVQFRNNIKFPGALVLAWGGFLVASLRQYLPWGGYWERLHRSPQSLARESGLPDYVGGTTGPQSDVATSITVINNEMTVKEILGQLTNRGCNDITQQLGESQYEYPVSSGGFGDIYLGTLKDGRVVGLKCIKLTIESNDSGQKKLLETAQELYVWSKCNHPNVMGLLGVARYRNRLVMVSTWMENGDMRQFLSQYPQVDRYPLSVQIADGVAYLHGKGIVHGDIKGANILISHDQTPKITDFGNAALKEHSLRFDDANQRAAVSIRWAAPELFEGGARTTQADVYALGMTILETITGMDPYHEDLELWTVMGKKFRGLCPNKPELDIVSLNEHANTLWSLLLDCWTNELQLRPTATEMKRIPKGIASGLFNSYVTKIPHFSMGDT